MKSQKEMWQSDFGSDYTERNIYGPKELNTFYLETYGVSRLDMNLAFLEGVVPKDARILEVGCNVGNQLRLLQDMGYTNLYGVELQPYAVERAKELTSNINIIQGVGDDIPFKDGFFDLVFTSGVLIHIPPTLIEKVQTEIIRCSKNYIWGFEYYEQEYTQVIYRGNEDLLWKGDFCDMYRNIEALEVVKTENYKYLKDENIDQMYLLKKK